MTPDKRRTTPLVQLLATGWSHAHGGKPLNLVPCRWRMTQEAVTAGLALPYHSGAMEGNVNKIKMIKRQMYGRASFALLRKRVIFHPA